MIDQFAFETIQSEPTENLLKVDAIACVSQSVLESILHIKGMEATELTLFQALSVWTNAELHLVAQEHTGSSHVKRRSDAEGMIKHILLERIPPHDLLTVVEPFSFVTKDQLIQAYRLQAIKIVQQPFYSFKQLRNAKQTGWQSSGKNVFVCTSKWHGVELLRQNEVIRLGTCKKWTIKFERCLHLPPTKSIVAYFLGVKMGDGCTETVEGYTILTRTRMRLALLLDSSAVQRSR